MGGKAADIDSNMTDNSSMFEEAWAQHLRLSGQQSHMLHVRKDRLTHTPEPTPLVEDSNI